jgi:hypothetical protein
MSSEESIMVAVRVRPFNSREEELKSKCIVEMEGKQTRLIDPKSEVVKKFTFDYSYWSHDKSGASFATNQMVFDDLGKIVLDNAWGGYNCCLFAYGQTGAGKSYSMVGTGGDKGIVPLAMEEMFSRIRSNENENVKYLVEVSMIEIYNETIQDLIDPQKKKGGLRVRDHPLTGPYVEGLSKHLAKDYSEIELLMERGTKNRTVHATKMNKTSSRAHTIFQITLVARTYDEMTKKSASKTSRINLVDLAGSERLVIPHSDPNLNQLT